jgi:uncharacterized protein (TIGR02147 family)
MRSFARDIGVAPGRLSEILAGKAGLSDQSADRIATELALSDKDKTYFRNLAEAEHGRSFARRAKARADAEKFERKYSESPIDVDDFKLISEWRHLAILELISSDKKRITTRETLARKLGLTLENLDQYLQRLVRLRLVEESDDRLIEANHRTSVAATPDHHAVRTFHDSMLSMAKAGLYSKARSHNEYSATLIAVPPNRLEKARSMIKDFWREFCEEMASASNEEARLYCLSVQLFNLLGDNDEKL